MPNYDRRNWLRFVTGSAAGPVLATEPAAAQVPSFAPPLSGREIMRQRHFPNVPLTTHEGRRVRFYDDLIKDKIVVLNLMYADCEGICPTVTLNLARTQQLLNERIKTPVHIVSLTVNPQDDTPQKLREYATMHEAGGNWLFATGAPDDLELLRQRLGFTDLNPAIDKDKSSHSGMIRYGNEPLSLWGGCPGNTPPEWMLREISFVIPGPRIADPS
jgi:protein SCO1/2